MMDLAATLKEIRVRLLWTDLMSGTCSCLTLDKANTNDELWFLDAFWHAYRGS